MRTFFRSILITLLSLPALCINAERAAVAAEAVTAHVFIADSEITAGEDAALYVELTNPDREYVSVQFDVVLPEPFTLVKVARVTSRIQSVEEDGVPVYAIDMQSSKRPDGSVRVIMVPNTSVGKLPFTGTSGSIVRLDVKTDANVVPGTYTASLKNIRLTGVNAKTDYVDDALTTLTVKNPEPKYYRVTHCIDGSTFKTQNVQQGQPVTNPSVPDRVGYTFSGWDKVITSMPARDEVINGSFSSNSYAVTFLDDEGTVISTTRQCYGAAITLPEDEPSKEGYLFVGYFEDPDMRQGTVPAAMPAHDVWFTAVFDINSYRLRFLDSDGSVLSSLTLPYHNRVTPPATPSRVGHTFAGWSPAVPELMPAGDMDIKATYMVNSYLVTFLIDGMTIWEDEMEYGTPIVFPNVSKRGYTFSGWDRSEQTVPDHDVEFNGTFLTDAHTLTFVADGKEFYTLHLAYGAEIPLIEAPQIEGYTFQEWTGLPSAMPDYDLMVTARYSVNSYVATFLDFDAVTPIQTYTLEYGQTIPQPAAPIHEGFTFSSYGEVNATMPAHDVSYIANYTRHSHKVTMMVSGEVWKQQDVPYGNRLSEVWTESPAMVGYDFAGWGDAPETMPDNEITVVAEFVRTTYHVDGVDYTPDLNADGTALTGCVTVVGLTDYTQEVAKVALKRAKYAETKTEARNVILPSSVATEKEGSLTVASIASAAFANTSITGLTLPETLTKIESSAISDCPHLKTLVFLGTDVPDMASGAIQLSESIDVFLPAAASDGFEEAITCQQDPQSAVTDVNISKAAPASNYRVTVSEASATAPEDVSFHSFGDDVVLTAPEREGYDIVWTDHTTDLVSYVNPYVFTATRDAAITWEYKIKTYRLSIFVNGETYYDSTFTYDASLPAISTPHQDGYRLVGWDLLPARMPAHDVVINASLVLVGDVTNDSQVSIGDMAALIDYLYGTRPPVFNRIAADTDDDGTITSHDVEILEDVIIQK